MKVLISNIYSYKNKGDAAIVLSTIKFFKEYIGATDITLLSDYYKENAEFYDNYKNIKPFYSLNKSKCKLCKIIIFIITIIKIIITLPLILLFKKYFLIMFKNLNSTLREYYEADVIVACGGGYLYSGTSVISIGLIMHLLQIKVAKSFGKKIILFPQSIGPFNKKIDYILTKWALKEVDIICPREEVSKELIDNIDCKSKILLIPDIAFMLDKKIPQEMVEKYNLDNSLNKKIGITAINYEYFIKGSDSNIYIDKMSKIINTLISLNYDIYLIPQVVLNNYDNDFLISKRIMEKIKSNNIYLIEESLSPMELKGFYSNMDYFIGSRMHSCILALDSKVNTIGLAYQYKTTGLYKYLNLENLCYDIQNFDADEIIEYVLSNEKEEIKLDKVYEKYDELKKEILLIGW